MNQRERAEILQQIAFYLRTKLGIRQPDQTHRIKGTYAFIPPILSSYVFNGVPLHEIMIPNAKDSFGRLAYEFSRSAFKIAHPEQMKYEPWGRFSTMRTRQLVGNSPERFIIVAAMQRGRQLIVDENTLICDNGVGRFGIEKGVLKFDYSDQIPSELHAYNVNWQKVCGWRRRRIKCPFLIECVTNAVTLEQHALIGVLTMCNTNPLNTMFAKPFSYMDRRVIEGLFALDEGCVPKLFSVMVPQYMTKAEFYALLGDEKYDGPISERRRARCYNTLIDLGFYGDTQC